MLANSAWTARLPQTQLFRLAVVAAVLLLAALLGPRASVMYLVLFAGVGAAVVFVRKPELGLVALVVAALSVPISLSTGTQTSVHGAVLLIPVLIAVWVVEMVRQRSVRLVPSSVNLPSLAFALSAAISFLSGNLPWNLFAGKASLQSQLGGLAVFVFSAAVLLWVGNQVRDIAWLKTITMILMVVGAVAVMGRALPIAAAISNRLVVPEATGSLFWIWVAALAGGQALFNRSLTQTERLLVGALAVGTFAAGWLFARSWVSGWLPPFVVLLTLVYLRSWRLGLFITAIGALGVLIRAPDLVPGLMGTKQYSADSRLEAWAIMLGQVIPNNPILGLGPANYYFYTPLYSIWGYYVSFNSHNQYVDILAQTGIVGLITFAWLIVCIGRLGWQLREQCGDGFARGYVYGCLAGLVGSLASGMLGDWFLPFVYNIGLAGFRASMLGWLFLGGLVAIEQMAKQQNANQALAHGTLHSTFV